MRRLGGYRISAGAVNCPGFHQVSSALGKLAASPPGSEHIIPEYTPVSDQLSLGSCTAQATADSLELLKGLEDPTKVVQVSRLMLYYDSRNYHGETQIDAGAYLGDALDSTKKLGICREDLWNYDISKVFVQPPIECYREGNSNKITEFYQIATTGNARQADIETAIRANHPVVFGFQVGADFEAYSGEEGKVFDPPAVSLGGHAVIITGIRYNAAGALEFWIRNSWSNFWGSNGHAWISGAYIDTIVAGDCFVPTRMIDFLV